MTKTRAAIAAAVVLLAVAFLVGFWPQRQGRVAAERELADVRTRLAAAEDRVRAAAVLGQLLAVRDAVAAQNYGEARQLSSAFFDVARAESPRTSLPGMSALLENVLRQRDGVISALALGDPAVAGPLRQMEVDLRGALGFAVPSVPPR
jgi:hypothetical protein